MDNICNNTFSPNLLNNNPPFTHVNVLRLSLRIKPILDEFQSCYRDSFRWYGGMYFVYWTILQLMIITSNYIIFQTVLIMLIVTHCLIQPYSQKWLNVMDGALLGCLAISSSLIAYQSDMYDGNYRIKQDIILHIFTILPLTIIAGGMAWIILTSLGLTPHMIYPVTRCFQFFGRCKQFQNHTSNRNTSSITIENPSSPDIDREPLIYYLQQENADYGSIETD